MESELYEAAVKGNVSSLRELLAKDKLLLDRIMTGNHTETPLHIAAMLGHLEFVEEVLARKAELARVQNSQGSTPLHLAAAKGYLNIVESLLRISPDLCSVHDKYKRNPLHVAGMKGHVDVLEFLVRARPDAARSVVEHDQTILHLCVQHNRLGALKRLIDNLGDDEFINSTDEYGNTVLHLAAADGQTETMLFLTNKGVNLNIKNSKGFTALDLLTQGKRKERKRKKRKERKRKKQDNMHNMLMVVAILIATIAFEAGRETKNFEADGNKKEELMTKYKNFIVCNTISFITSLSVIMLLISGLPLEHRIPTRMVMLTMWVAVTFIAAAYGIVIEVSCPKGGQLPARAAGWIAVLVWVGLMALIFLYHVVRLIHKSTLKSLKNESERISYLRGCILLQPCLSQKKCTEP